MRFSAVSFAAIVAAGLIGTAQPAAAQLEEILDGVGFGKEKDPITYRERAPLVVPPNLNLRPPEEKPVALREAKWPNDPDVLRKKAAEEEGKKPRDFSGLRSNQSQGLLLSNDELRKGRVLGGGEIGQRNTRNNNGYDNDLDGYGRINPDRLRAQGDAFRGTQEPPLKPGEEPKRKYLTDPPVGVRAAAANAPLVATQEKRVDNDEESSPYAFFRKITGSDD